LTKYSGEALEAGAPPRSLCEGVALAAGCLEAGLAAGDAAVVRRLAGFIAAPTRAWFEAEETSRRGGSVSSDAQTVSSSFSMLSGAECAEGITARLRIAVLTALARAGSLEDTKLAGAVLQTVDMSAVSTRWLQLLVDFAAAAAAGGPRVAAASGNSLTAAAARNQDSFGLTDGGGGGHGPGSDKAPATHSVPVLGLVPPALRRRGAVFCDLAGAWMAALEALTASAAGETGAALPRVALPPGADVVILALCRMALCRSLRLADGGGGGAGAEAGG